MGENPRSGGGASATGYEAAANNRIAQTFNLLSNLGQIHLPSVGLALLTLVLAVVLLRTGMNQFASLLAIVVPTLLVDLFSIDEVQIVQDVGEIPPACRRSSCPRWRVPSMY